MNTTKEPETPNNEISTPEADEATKKIRWRKNVIALMVLAYSSIIVLFLLMAAFGMDPKDAANIVSVPFVALIGGTLAVIKDLL